MDENKKIYQFNSKEISDMYDNVCDESIELSNAIIENNSKDTFDKLAVHVTIGNHTVIIPNNADNIEVIFGAINECIKQTM